MHSKRRMRRSCPWGGTHWRFSTSRCQWTRWMPMCIPPSARCACYGTAWPLACSIKPYAAHERVMLERLEHALARHERSQLLLEPIVTELPRSLRGALDDYVAALTALGFTVEAFGDGAAIVRAAPAALRSRDLERVLQET